MSTRGIENSIPRKLLILACLLFLVAANMSPSSADSKESESWVTPDRFDAGFQGILVSDLINSQQIFSILKANSSKPVAGSTYLCKSVQDLACKDADSYWFNAVLPTCSDLLVGDCIRRIVGQDSSGKSEEAKFVNYVYPNHINNFEPAPQLRIPKAATPSIWSLPSFRHNGGDLYALISGVSGVTYPSNPRAPESFYAYFVPVQRVTTDWIPQTTPNKDGFIFFYPQCIPKNPGTSGESRVGCKGMVDQGVGQAQYKCVLWADEGRDCYIQRPFPKSAKFEIDFRLNSEISGWLHGRLLNPSISVNPGVNDSTELSITAQPLEVPIYYHGDKFINLPEKIKASYANQGHLSQGGGYSRICCEAISDPLLRNVTSTPNPYGSSSISELQLWLDNVSDKAVATPSVWSVRTMNTSELSNSAQCLKSGRELKGIVATNSTTYSDGPPEFKDNALVYRVASPHLQQDGEAFKGTYNLIIRSDVARCLYGFSKAPISAKIEVVTEAGVNSVATTLFNETDGWIFLSANNFTFSSPVIRAELMQAMEKPIDSTKVEVPEKTSNPVMGNSQSSASTSVPKSKIRTITCVKGKKQIKISAVKPKCPKGFKSKS